MSSEVAIKVNGLGKCYQIYNSPRDRLKQFILPRVQNKLGLDQRKFYSEFWALQNIGFEILKGETVGILGLNGSGKSTLLQLVCGILTPSTGKIDVSGRVAALLELGSGFNPEFTGRENVYMNAAVLGLSQNEINEKFTDIVDFADIEQFIDQPVKNYSSGMMLRLAFAVSINVNPEVLVVDEALAVGDAAFQRKCMRKIEELTSTGTTLLFVSHDIEAVRKICARAIYLKKGKVQLQGNAKEVCMAYEKDIFGSPNSINPEPDKPVNDKIETALIDPELQNTNEEIYGDGRVQITDISITDQNLNRINIVSTGSEFNISYKVKFFSDSSKPIFGIMITTKEGICVFGTNTNEISISKQDYKKNDNVEITFILKNNLGSGVYYLTCGVHANDTDEGLIYLQRRIDTLMLKSIQSDERASSGMAYLEPKIMAQRVKN